MGKGLPRWSYASRINLNIFILRILLNFLIVSGVKSMFNFDHNNEKIIKIMKFFFWNKYISNNEFGKVHLLQN